MPLRLGAGGRQINRVHSPLLARAMPWIVVICASVIQTLPLIASAPLMPPLGFMALLAWRQLNPGLLPVWAGLPLGFADDLVSGQPMGSAMLLWSITMISLDIIEQRFPWRSYVLDWAVASGFITAYLLLCTVIAAPARTVLLAGVIGPQLMLAVLLFPLVERGVALCDKLRLLRFRSIA